jgi:hypothetical protein
MKNIVIKVIDFNNLDLSQYVYEKELIAFRNNINDFDINNEIHLSKRLLKKNGGNPHKNQ